MGRRSAKFMMAIPIQSFKYAKVSLKNLFAKKFRMWQYMGNLRKQIMANKGIKI